MDSYCSRQAGAFNPRPGAILFGTAGTAVFRHHHGRRVQSYAHSAGVVVDARTKAAISSSFNHPLQGLPAFRVGTSTQSKSKESLACKGR